MPSNAALTGEVMLATLLRFFAAKVTILLNPFERLVRSPFAFDLELQSICIPKTTYDKKQNPNRTPLFFNKFQSHKV